MPTYSEWLASTTALYAAGMTSAYNNRNNEDTTNPYYLAWQTIIATSDLNTIRIDLGSTSFQEPTPTASEADILLFQGWLQQNPVAAGQMGLEPTLAFRSSSRSNLGGGGLVGTGEGAQQRRWKGSPVYTFANGILVGKGGDVVAAIGTEGGQDLDGFGTDTIAYFDGVPFSTGTGVPGSVVFRGDTVVSGSIKGTGGVVIIEDVIQLERDVDSPAGIGVDSDGKIRLRHRGEGFIDLVDEINTVQTNLDNSTNTAADIAKLWMGVQNTSSARWGTSLIPNSNFSLLSVDSGDYSERPAGVISVGTTSNILSIPTAGVGRFDASTGKGICFQAIPIESSRYAFRIRYKGGPNPLEPSVDGSQQGLFIAFHETTDSLETIGDSSFIYDNLTPSGAHETSDVHTSNVTVVYPDGSTSEDGGSFDGVSIQSSYQVKSFTYTPTAGTQAASLVIWTKNYTGESLADYYIDIDYVVLNEKPLSLSEVQGEISDSLEDISLETDDSLVPDPQMKDIVNWASYDGAVLSNGTDGITDGDEAITVDCTGLVNGGGIISSQIEGGNGQYIIGAKVRVISAANDPVLPQISMFVIENGSLSPAPFGGASITPLAKPPTDSNVASSVDIVSLNSSGDPVQGSAGSSVPISIATTTMGGEPLYTTIVGTYEATLKYQGTDGTIYASFDRDIPMVPLLPTSFSIVIKANADCIFSVDYTYARVQSTSANIAQELADSAYVDAQAFVTEINELLIKESGSILPNASMGALDISGNPIGWRSGLANGGTLTYSSAGDGAIQISAASGPRTLITPAFGLGTADKFSIGIRIKGLAGAVTPTIKLCTTSELVVLTNYVTIADQSYGNSDVWVPSDAVLTNALTTDPVSTTGTTYANLLATWDRTALLQQPYTGGLASIIIQVDGYDFEVDYIFVKEQTVSFDLADNQAQERKAEAISAAAGFVGDIGDSLTEEVGSLISNAGFSSWYVEDDGSGTEKQRPQKWLRTRDAGFPYRVLETTEIVDNTGNMSPTDLTANQAKETILGTSIGLQGSAVKFDPGNSGGILSAKWQLPLSDATAVAAGTATTGTYTIAIRLKVSSQQTVGVRIYAHEYYSYTDAAQTHVFCSDGYGNTTLEGADQSGTSISSLKLFSEVGSEGQVNRIPIINVSNPGDTTPGYDPNYSNDNDNTNDYQDAGDDQYVEYIPIDDTSSDGTPSAATGNENLWYDIAGTYKPDANTKYVSFEILIDGDPDGGSIVPDIYVDYVSFVVQPFDSDFAETLADARIESLTGIGSSDWIAQSTTLAALLLQHNQQIATLDATLAAEDPESTLIPNSFFKDDTAGTPDKWIPTRNTDGEITLQTTALDPASYGSYITMGGTDSTRGILSEAIPVVGYNNLTGLTDGGLTSNPNFDLAIRYRSKNPISYLDFYDASAFATSYVSTTGTLSTWWMNASLDRDAPNVFYQDDSEILMRPQDLYHSSARYELGDGQNAAYDLSTYYGDFQNDEGFAPTDATTIFRMETPSSNFVQDPYLDLRGMSSGFIRVFDTSGTLTFSYSFSSETQVTPLTGLSAGTAYWVHVYIDAFPIFAISNGSGNDILKIQHWGIYTNQSTSTGSEPITLQIIAHEYYDTGGSFDPSVTKYVYANGATFTHPTNYDSTVTRYATGAAGVTKSLDAILREDSEGSYTETYTTTQTSSNIWKTLIALYKPFEYDGLLNTLPRWVSFEFVLNGDPDNDNLIPEIYIDGILLQASQETPLLTAVQERAIAAQTSAGNALSLSQTNEVTIQGHTTSIAAISAAQDEAQIAQVGITNEEGSLLYNAGFVETYDDSFAMPAGFYPFEDTKGLIRIQNNNSENLSFDYANADSQLAHVSNKHTSPETLHWDVGQSGIAMAVLTNTDSSTSDDYSAGFYTRAIPLPVTSNFSYTDGTGTSVEAEDRGTFTVAIKVKPAGSPVSVRIVPLEYTTDASPSNENNYIYDTRDGTRYRWGYKINNESDSAPQLRNNAINTFVLNQISGVDTTSSTHEIAASGVWTTLAGSYTPSADAKTVSFAVLFTYDNDDETSDSTPDTAPDGTSYWFANSKAMVYVDYMLVTPATFSVSLAQDVAAGEAYAVQQTLSEEIGNLEGNLGSEGDSLMPNGNFLSTFSESSVSYAKSWVPTGHTSPDNKLRLYSAAQSSIGTYAKFLKNAASVDATYDTYVSGVISKAVQNPSQIVTDVNGNINNINIGLRVRGTTLQSSISPNWSSVEGIGQYYPTSYSGLGGNFGNNIYKPSTADWGSNSTPPATYTQDSITLANVPTNYDGELFAFSMLRAKDDPSYPNTVHNDYWTVQNDNTNWTTLPAVGSKMRYRVNNGVSNQHQFLQFSFNHFYNGPNNTSQPAYVHFKPMYSGTTVTTGFHTSLWWTPDNGANWYKLMDQRSNGVKYELVYDNKGLFVPVPGHGAPPFYSATGGSLDGRSSILLLFQADPTDINSILPQMDEVVVYIENIPYSQARVSMGSYNYYLGSVGGTLLVPDFSIRIRAHETFLGISDGNIIVADDGVAINATPHASSGVSLFTFDKDHVDGNGDYDEGQVTLLNLIDLGYSDSTASTEITIDADVVDDDNNETIQDWRNIVGSYTPDSRATAVSFEVLIDHNVDADNTIQEVWLDSVTAAVSSVSSDLASSIADQRVFVEQNFRGGQGSIHASNVIQNPNFNEAIDIGGTLYPAGWTSDDSTFGFNNSLGTEYDRVVTMASDGTTRMTSRPFEILSTKYRCKVTYKNETAFTTNSNEGLFIHLVMTDQFVSRDNLFGITNLDPTSKTYYPEPSSIRPTAAIIQGSYTADFGFFRGGGVEYTMLTFGPDDANLLAWMAGQYTQTNDTSIQTIQFDIELLAPSVNRAYATYGSLELYSIGSTNVHIYEVQLIPVGQTYGQGTAQAVGWDTGYDTEGDPLPDAPRETTEQSHFIDSFDIRVTDTTGNSDTDSAIMVATPRKYYDTSNGSTPQGTSYLYPGVTDFYYLNRPKSLLWFDGSSIQLGELENTRTLKFPSTSHNRITDVNYIKFSTGDGLSDGLDDISEGFTNDGQSGDSMIDGLGALVFSDYWEPSGGGGNAGEGRSVTNNFSTSYGTLLTEIGTLNMAVSPNVGEDITLGVSAISQSSFTTTSYSGYDTDELRKIGPHIRGVHSVYVGPQWGHIAENANGVSTRASFGMDYILSDGLNGFGTTLGNIHNTMGTDGEKINQFNRKGGVYVKCKNAAYGITMVRPGSNEERWSIGIGYYNSGVSTTSSNYLSFHYGADENSVPVRHGYLLNSSSGTTGDLMNFTGQHRCEDLNDSLESSEKGLIVVSTGRYNNLNEIERPTINSALPIVELSSKRNQKSCFGVLSDKEDRDGAAREYSFGNFVSVHDDGDDLDRLIINSLGEGAVWVCNINGDLENGDYITTCEIPGYGMLQDDDLLHNYTVAKITQDCTFELDNPYYDCVEFEFEGQTYRKAFVGCTYHCG